MLEELRRGGKAAVERWHALRRTDGRRVRSFRRVDLSRAILPEVQLYQLNFEAACFDWAQMMRSTMERAVLHDAKFRNTDLRRADLRFARLRQADFSGAHLVNAKLDYSLCRGSRFCGADMRKANLRYADLRGANFADANLDGAFFERTCYDETTTLPEQVQGAKGLLWRGRGAPPHAKRLAAKYKAMGRLSYARFVERLRQYVAKPKVDKALHMLKKPGAMPVLCEVQSDQLVGVVPGRGYGHYYSCRLTHEGCYSCGTHELYACPGLMGSVCKHILAVLLVAVRENKLKPNTADSWFLHSLAQRPTWDKDSLCSTLFLYKVDDVDVDWRPPEAIAEDYYA